MHVQCVCACVHVFLCVRYVLCTIFAGVKVAVVALIPHVCGISATTATCA